MPLLLLILNKVDEREVLSSKEASLQWFSRDSPAYKLGMFYDDPTIIYVPDKSYKEKYETSINDLIYTITAKLMKKFKNKRDINKLWNKSYILAEIKRVFYILNFIFDHNRKYSYPFYFYFHF